MGEIFSTLSQKRLEDDCISEIFPASSSPRANSRSYDISTSHVRVKSFINHSNDYQYPQTSRKSFINHSNNYQYPQTSRWHPKVSPYQGISIILVIIATIIALVFYIKKVEKNKKNKDLPNQIQV